MYIYIHIHIYVIYTGCIYLYIVYIYIYTYVTYLYRGPSAWLRNALLPAVLGRTGQLGVFATFGGSSGSRRGGWPNIGPLVGGL